VRDHLPPARISDDSHAPIPLPEKSSLG